MSNEEAFSVWAPDDSIWSPWVKPVLFSHLPDVDLGPVEFTSMDVRWAPHPDDQCAIVVDLPGDRGVQLGIQLAGLGYCPVPLYNAIPLRGDAAANSLQAAIDVIPILRALRQTTPILRAMKLNRAATPAFLLDANRKGRGVVEPNQFDNRSVSFTTDFPSANFLRAQQIDRAILVTARETQPQEDLAHTLRKWQEGGIQISLKRLSVPGRAEAITIQKPSMFGFIFQRALAAAGFRRSPTGGFGDWVPDPTSHGGGG